MKHSFLVLLFTITLFTSCISQKDYTNSIEEYRTNYYKSFAAQDDGPIEIKDLANINFYPIKSNYRCQCTLTLTPDSKPFNLKTYSNIEKPYRKYAEFNCPLNGEKIKISAYLSLLHTNHPVYNNRLFIPFMDLTNGDETYGGGRYIDINISEIENNKVILDFNRAYNPWCAYSEGYNCPIPPRENHLEIAIEAGEKNYTGEIKVK